MTSIYALLNAGLLLMVSISLFMNVYINSSVFPLYAIVFYSAVAVFTLISMLLFLRRFKISKPCVVGIDISVGILIVIKIIMGSIYGEKQSDHIATLALESVAAALLLGFGGYIVMSKRFSEFWFLR